MYKTVLLLFAITNVSFTLMRDKRDCQQSKTVVSGWAAKNNYCVGDLVFEDNFDSLDSGKWKHEVTFWGGGNHEFQWYTDDSKNSFTKDGNLFIRPSLTSDYLGGDDKLYSETVDLGSACTIGDDNGCKRTGTPEDILNPIRSARLNTANSFAFKYGRVEIRARMPSGDWLWPALWLFPKDSKYGIWPRSGEIDMAESRGNKKLLQGDTNIGSASVGSTLHWGPDAAHDGYAKTHYEQYEPNDPYDAHFKNYEIMWTPDYLRFTIDGKSPGTADPRTSFWDLGEYAQQGLTDNPWAGGGKMAPFDQEFFFIINLAIGGTNGFFPDDATNYPSPKPWKDSAPHAMTDFWNARNQWLPTWKLGENDGYDASFKIDYVRVWAI